MNLLEMRTRVRETIRDDAKQWITDNEITDWINEAYYELASRFEHLRHQATGTVTDSIALPTTPPVVRIQLLVVDGDEQPIVFVDEEAFQSYRLSGAAPTVRIARVFDGVIHLWPTLEVATDYTLDYVALPSVVLAGDTDTPELPEHLHPRLIRYAQAQAMLKSDDLQRYGEYQAMFHAGLPEAPGTTHNDRPGPLQLSPELGYFDSADYLR